MQNAGDYLTDVGSGPKATPWSATSPEPQDTALAGCSRAGHPGAPTVSFPDRLTGSR
jgi:hypothetical protein